MANENKTRPTGVPVGDFLAGVENERRRADAAVLLDMMTRLTGETAVMWGPSMIGFGAYHYRYGSGREGDALAVGFSPRKSNLVLYGLTYSPEAGRLLERLGRHRKGAACLYINKLDDVELPVLEELVTAGYRHMTTVMDQA